MLETVLSSGRETLLLAIPSVALLLVSVFRLERLIAGPKQTRERASCGLDTEGQPILTDPDGRPSGSARMR